MNIGIYIHISAYIWGRRTYKNQTKHTRNETCQVKSPFPTNDVDQDAPRECANSKSRVRQRIDLARLSIRHIHLLVDGRGREPDALRPRQVEKVAKAAEEPDTDLISAQPEAVQFNIDQSRLLLKRGERMGGIALENSPDGELSGRWIL